jgi:hypothetical protein
MTRAELEHLIRAAAEITREQEHVIIGAAALLGAHPDPPDDLRRTMEADMYPRRRPDLADDLEVIGELSQFHQRFHVYAHPVGPETAVLPDGWEERLVRVQNANTNQAVGYCLEPHDLAASKLAAGREKDKEFVSALLEHRLIDSATLLERVERLPLTPDHRLQLSSWVSRSLEAGSKRDLSKGDDGHEREL